MIGVAKIGDSRRLEERSDGRLDNPEHRSPRPVSRRCSRDVDVQYKMIRMSGDF